MPSQRMKQRYVQKHFHPMFGYLIYCTLEKQPGTSKAPLPLQVKCKHPELKDGEVPFLPLAWNAEDAMARFERKEPFAVITKDTHMGFCEKEDFEHIDSPPNFKNVLEAAPVIRSGVTTFF